MNRSRYRTDLRPDGSVPVTGFLDYKENGSPGDPDADHARLYSKAAAGTTVMCYRDSAGKETVLGAGWTGVVLNFAALPSAAANAGAIYLVQETTGLLWDRRRGLYESDGATWERLSNATFQVLDNEAVFSDNDDNTKKLNFELSGISSGATSVLTVPDADGKLFLTSGSQAMSGDLDMGDNDIVSCDSLTIATSSDNAYGASVVMTRVDDDAPFVRTSVIGYQTGDDPAFDRDQAYGGSFTADVSNAYLNVGVYGEASGTYVDEVSATKNIGVYGAAQNGLTNWAGYFSGDVNIDAGDLYLDTANKSIYLGLDPTDLRIYSDGTHGVITTTGNLNINGLTIDASANLTTATNVSANALILTGDTSVISSAHEIDIKPNGDVGDYISIQTSSNVSGFNIVKADTGHTGAFEFISNSVEAVSVRVKEDANNLAAFWWDKVSNFASWFSTGKHRIIPNQTTSSFDNGGLDISYESGAGTVTIDAWGTNDLVITASGGDISFGNGNLTTTGDMTCDELHYTTLDPPIAAVTNYWQSDAADTGLTGDKTGNFALTTTGKATVGDLEVALANSNMYVDEITVFTTIKLPEFSSNSNIVSLKDTLFVRSSNNITSQIVMSGSDGTVYATITYLVGVDTLSFLGAASYVFDSDIDFLVDNKYITIGAGSDIILYSDGDDANFSIRNNLKLGLSGGAGNYTNIDAYGKLTLVGDATVWDDYVTPIGPNNWNGSSNNPTLTKLFDDGSGSQGVYGYVWSVGDEALVTVQMPHKWLLESTIYPHVHFMCLSDVDPSDNIGIEFEYTWCDIGEDFSANSTLVTVDLPTGVNSDDKHQLGNITASGISGTGHGLSSILLCRIKRVAGSTNPYAGGVAILDFDIHYQIDAIGSDTIITK